MSKIFASNNNIYGTKYSYGFKVTRNFKKDIKFDNENYTNLWRDMIGLETANTNYFQTPRQLKRVTKAPDNNTFVTVNMYFNIIFSSGGSHNWFQG